MKIELMFKTPDVSDQLDAEELEAGRTVIEKFIKYGECVNIEFDTETQTATVKRA